MTPYFESGFQSEMKCSKINLMSRDTGVAPEEVYTAAEEFGELLFICCCTVVDMKWVSPSSDLLVKKNSRIFPLAVFLRWSSKI